MRKYVEDRRKKGQTIIPEEESKGNTRDYQAHKRLVENVVSSETNTNRMFSFY